MASSNKAKEIWVLSGGNGAGKSTFYTKVLQPNGALLVNADVIAKSMSPENPESESYAAAQTAMILLRSYLEAGRSFAYETVFSHPSKIDLLKYAKQLGYTVNLVYIHLDDGLHRARVSQRVKLGGHSVDPEKIISRLPRTIVNVTEAAKHVDTFMLFDNSNKDHPFRLIAKKQGDQVHAMEEKLPKWAVRMLFHIR